MAKIVNIAKDTDAAATSPPMQTVDDVRIDLALKATHQIEVLANLLLNSIGSDMWDMDYEPEQLLLSMGVRVKALNSAIMSALGDDLFDVDELHYAVTGRHRCADAHDAA